MGDHPDEALPGADADAHQPVGELTAESDATSDGGLGGSELPVGRRSWPIISIVLGVCIAATLVGMVLLWPDAERERRDSLVSAGSLVRATVTDVRTVPCAGTEELATPVLCDGLVVRIDTGDQAGSVVEIRTIGEGSLPPGVDVGVGVVLGESPTAPPAFRYAYVDRQRDAPLLALVALFVVVSVLLGRWQGARAIVGLVLSLAVVIGFVLPAISSGHDPVAVAIVGGAAVAIPALYLAHGVSWATSVALLGTFASLALTGILGWIAVRATGFTGLAGEEALSIAAVTGVGELRGLLLAGIVIGAIGVLDDVTVTQVAAVREVRRAAPHSSVGDLYSAGIRVGRDHIAATVNTLVLAYTGASLPLLVLLSEATLPLGALVTTEVVASEVVRALVGAVGLMAAVPITTAMAAAVLARD
ncbi:MAG: YibE/F family protein [Acidimicrobiia bacterium]|nr:YibE/F family protein [Acidimicrobiia bacterium]